MSGVYLHPINVHFGICDPAGVAYFPRFFDWFHQAMEGWFSADLGHPYHALLQRYGFPAVHTEADFRAPCRFGERVVVELRVGRLGHSTFQLDYIVRGDDGGLRATGSTTCAMIGVRPGEPDHFKSVAIPAPLRAAVQRFMDRPAPA